MLVQPEMNNWPQGISTKQTAVILSVQQVATSTVLKCISSVWYTRFAL